MAAATLTLPIGQGAQDVTSEISAQKAAAFESKYVHFEASPFSPGCASTASPGPTPKTTEVFEVSTPSSWHLRSASKESPGDAAPESPSPMSWRVRNTFLDSPVVDPTLLEVFQRSRRTSSAPPVRRSLSCVVEEHDQEFGQEQAPVFAATPSETTPVTSPAPKTTMEQEEEDAFVATPETTPVHTPAPKTTVATATAGSAAPEPEFTSTLNLSAEPFRPSGPVALPLADLVTTAAPTPGSTLHYAGDCKPCAFFWKPVGCESGANCKFCHLCDRDERKRRNKEKKMAMYALQHGLTDMPVRALHLGGA